jgi:hypothetical protein
MSGVAISGISLSGRGSIVMPAHAATDKNNAAVNVILKTVISASSAVAKLGVAVQVRVPAFRYIAGGQRFNACTGGKACKQCDGGQLQDGHGAILRR